MSKITKDDLELMAALRADGMTLREIAEKFEISESGTHKALQSIGAADVVGPLSNLGNVRIRRAERAEGRSIEEALADYAARGYSVNFTASVLGISWKTLLKLARHYGISFVTERGKTEGYRTLPIQPMVEAARKKRLKEHGITHEGVTRSAHEWSRRLGGSTGLVSARLALGWSVAEAVTTPPLVRGFKVRKVSRRRIDTRNHVWRKDGERHSYQERA
jgi:hypothetical protein